MYDIDAGRSHALRLDSLRAPSADEEIAAIEKQMEALSLRHCELMEAKRVAFAQARPIPASDSGREHFEGFELSVSVERLTHLMQMGLSITDARMVGSSAVLTADIVKAARCTLTGNPCGTDTVAVGKSCPDERNGHHCAKVTSGLDEGTRPIDGVVQFSTDNDFWTHRHRVLSGTHP